MALQLCAICLDYSDWECSCTEACDCFEVNEACGIVWMRDEKEKPVQVAVCREHFIACAKVRDRHKIPLRLPLHLAEESPVRVIAIEIQKH